MLYSKKKEYVSRDHKSYFLAVATISQLRKKALPGSTLRKKRKTKTNHSIPDTEEDPAHWWHQIVLAIKVS